MAEMESWKNVTPGRIVIKKFNSQNELKGEMLTPGKVLHLTPAERRINQELAASPKLDFFQNGYLTPVRLIETEDDAKELASNPNLMGESEMADLFKGNWRAFDAKIADISNTMTLKRLLEMAEEPDNGATVRQVNALKARLEEEHPTVATEVEQAGPNDPMPPIRPVSPQ